MPTALIVEDEPEANLLLSMLVSLRGYQSTPAHTGAEAEAALDRDVPDVVFLDLMLPDSSGYEICQKMQARPETSLIPVVIVSARLADENRSRCYQAGAVRYVAKPYTPDEIFEALAAAEQWRDENARAEATGTMNLGDGDERVIRELSRLRALLTARTPLGGPEAGRIVGALESIVADAHSWGSRRDVERVACADYRLLDDRLIVTVRDESGWFSPGDLRETATRSHSDLDQVFDEVHAAESGRATVMVKRFDGAPSPPV